MTTAIKGWRERAGLLASYEITNPSSVERALLEEVAELRAELMRREALADIAAARSMLNKFKDPACVAQQDDLNKESAIQRNAARYKEQRDRMLQFMQNADVRSGVCCCGDDIERHGNPMDCGHSPVDMWDHSVLCWAEEIRKSDELAASSEASA